MEMEMYNVGSGASELFLKLPHILLTKIVRQLENNLDRICLSLVCRKFYDERDSYLSFNSDFIAKCTPFANQPVMFSRSYQKQFNDQINSEPKNSLLFISSSEIQPFGSGAFNQIFNDNSIEKIYFADNFKWDLNLYTKLIGNSNVKTIQLGWNFNDSIPPSSIPSNIETIIFGFNFNKELEVGSLPPNLKKIIFEGYFNKVFQPGVLPNSLEEIRFGSHYQMEFIVGSLPANLKVMEFTNDYDPPLSTVTLPPTLERITKLRARDLPQLPSSIKSISINGSGTIGQLPNGLEELTLCGMVFSLPKGWIPNTVTKLEFQQKVRYSLEGVIPNSVKHLSFEKNARVLAPGTIPSSVTTLKIHNCKQASANIIPKSVETLYVNENFIDINNLHSLPSSVRNIIVMRTNDPTREFHLKPIDNDNFILMRLQKFSVQCGFTHIDQLPNLIKSARPPKF
ncbi:hypothetical protein PPL_03922 [Heterostelium album PN500]|uniref:F-box domain-containing protein n=1 Tax=Heterostelium pallidum (strain ATCC 26659 / Pp 5 / PN500) TaxID=670386 RepID=D3B5I4_HETP5|nr:hypothetical protein PPL_03922 [Heterostelium album PN500]EFA83132.1 hypothetical protein PPL_03922 [Heterostelium album PN500]|eukprot:XP_020435249.1 hypothetical protein PPL_03922 [Heterostelium album PN500]